jgi:hypothetical protein
LIRILSFGGGLLVGLFLGLIAGGILGTIVEIANTQTDICSDQTSGVYSWDSDFRAAFCK